MSWHELFLPSTGILELFVRGTSIYFVIFILMRMVGRRETGELNTSDLILVVLVSEASSAGMTGDNNTVMDSILVILIIMGWNTALDAAGYRWKWVGRLLKARARVLIKNGRMQDKTMARELLTKDEIETHLRLNGIEDIAQVKIAHIEPNGSISIIRNG